MTVIYNISPGFLQTYITYQGKTKLDPEEIFKRLSFEMGGDGKTITKDQLDSYINDAESKKIKVDKTKLSALKQIQNNWDTIAKGKDSISYGDIADYKALLFATVVGDFTATEIDDTKASATDAIYDYLADYLGRSSRDEVTKKDLTSYLNDLISNSKSEDDSNSDLIGALTNLIADTTVKSTVEAEI